MTYNDNLNPAADFSSKIPSNLISGAPQVDEITYVRIRDNIVPTTFVKRVSENLACSILQYGSAVSIKGMFHEAFWYSLSTIEREVAGDCLIFLIEQEKILVWQP